MLTAESSAYAMLVLIGQASNGFGVERIDLARDSDYVEASGILLYVNRGDTYGTTQCYDVEEDSFFESSWGDWLEAKQNELTQCLECESYTSDPWPGVKGDYCSAECRESAEYGMSANQKNQYREFEYE